WMVSTLAAPGKPLKPTAPWSGIQLNMRKDPEVKELPKTGGLFVERQVGRGRVVVSAIRLFERDLINWRSGFESFFNACLLRRPPRMYSAGYLGGVNVNWADANLKDHRLDAALTTRLRYFARDLGVATSYHYEESADSDQPWNVSARAARR